MTYNIIRKIANSPLSLLVAGAAFSLCFAPYYWIILVPFLISFLVFRLNGANSKKTAFFRGFLFGFGFGAVSTSWIANAILLDENLTWVVPLALCGMGILFGLFYGLAGCLAAFYPKGGRRLFAFAAAMTILEWVRSWLFTGFPWNLIGSVWENTLPILQVAAVVGVYGLTFLTIITGGIFALWPKKKPIMAVIGAFLLLFLLGALRLYMGTQDTVWGVKLRLVQPNIPQTLKWDPKEAENSFMKIMRLSRENNDDITHTVWPESAVSFILNRDEDERLRLMQAVRQGGTLIMGGMRLIPEERTLANSLFILDDMANIKATYDKSHLVPFGEYVPFRGLLPLDKLVPIPFDFKEGSGIKTIRVPKTPLLGALVCYEVIFSGQVADKKNRPKWLVNVTNDGWYGLSAGPHQHLGMAKMRAVEEGLPLVRVANTGISAVFDGYGHTLGSLALGTEGVLDTALPEALPPTVYARFGVWIPLGFCFFLLIFLRKRK
ncbi:MAG: apolipoprotein N-acyltransferase [Alphaproteobacteria bacterium]|nr:apolipoprotein N-acyltransferase [Alphaproteobacteria bacterium]